MRHENRSAPTPLLIALLALCAAACTREDKPAPVPTPVPTPAPRAAAPQAPAVFAVKRIELGKAIGNDKKVAAVVTTFAPGDTIYASVLSDGAAPSVTLAARWLFEGDQLVSESSQTIAANGPAATEFHVSKPDGWPAGKYRVEVTADGKPAGTATFDVAG